MVQTFHYTEVEAQSVEGSEGVTIRWLMGRNVGAPNFVTRIIEVQPGGSTEHHGHAWEHEVFVLSGQGLVRDPGAGTEHQVGPGSCVYVAPDEVHQFVNQGEDILRFICVIPYPPAKE